MNTLAGWMVPVMNLALVVGVGVVLPLAWAQPARRWWPCAAAVALSLWLPAGVPAALCVGPWLVASLANLWLERQRRWVWLGSGFAVTAALALLTSRMEWSLFGITEPIVKLTALHFTYAGVGTLALAHRQVELQGTRLAHGVRALVFLAPPVVALGFLTRSAVAQVGGAVLMTLGVWGVAGLQGRVLPTLRTRRAQVAGAVSCLSPLLAMGLAVSWAAAQYWPAVPALTVPDMVPTHGALNAFGFVLLGLVAFGPSPQRAAEAPGERAR